MYILLTANFSKNGFSTYVHWNQWKNPAECIEISFSVIITTLTQVNYVIFCHWRKEHVQLCPKCSHLYFETWAAESSAEV